MDLEDASSQARFLIRDGDGKFPALFDSVLTCKDQIVGKLTAVTRWSPVPAWVLMPPALHRPRAGTR